MTGADIERAARELREALSDSGKLAALSFPIPPVHWRDVCTHLDDGSRLELANALLADSERLARFARYIENAGDHARAVKAQNRIGKLIRKAFGYVYDNPIRF